MAKDISKDLEKKYLFPNHFQLHVKIKINKTISFFRKIARLYLPNQKYNVNNIEPLIDNSFIRQKKHFKNHHWAFSNSFWKQDFYEDLIKQWPHDRYFETIKHITKSYDMGFIFNTRKKNHELLNNLNNFPAYKKAYNFLQSDNACRLVKEVTSSTYRYKCSHILLTRAYWGSSVIPHIDSDNEIGNVNIIIFINSSNKNNTGNLGIWKDNEFKENIFKPKNLKNSCLIYDMHDDFYHGFEPMDFGSFRWAMAVKFSPIT